jgi:hypothetical protein
MEWLKARWAERTSWDGGVLVGVGVVSLLFSPWVEYAAYAAIVYGVWTLIRKEL